MSITREAVRKLDATIREGQHAQQSASYALRNAVDQIEQLRKRAEELCVLLDYLDHGDLSKLPDWMKNPKGEVRSEDIARSTRILIDMTEPKE